MGRKKSVVLMVLLTIVIVALCALTVFPAFTFPWNKVNGWQPAISSLDAGAELRGGYYTYYYPQGVISATEYEDNYENFPDTEDGRAERDKYADKYVAHKGLYLEKSEKLGIFDDEDKENLTSDDVSADFKEEFAAVTAEICSRFEQKGFSHYRVAVIDDYSIRVEVPAAGKTANGTDSNAEAALVLFRELGTISVKNGEESIAEFVAAQSLTEYIQSFSVETEYGYAYLVVTFTANGQSVIGALKDGLSAYGTESGTFLNFYLGDETTAVIAAGSDNFTADMRIKYPMAQESNRAQVETYSILLNSMLQTNGFDIQFVSGEINEVADDNTMMLVYIAIGIMLLVCLVVPVIRHGKFGLVGGYNTLSYLIVVGLCFAFITGGIFEITLGSLLVFLFGLILMTCIQAYIYAAIKKEVLAGKTVLSAVKKGYGKTIWHVIDVYAVLLLGALAFLIGGAGVNGLAVQAIICVVTAAFCNLLWGRGINYVFLSACKDKYKYFRFVREDDDDED